MCASLPGYGGVDSSTFCPSTRFIRMYPKEFDADEENFLRSPLEGQLNKYTNVMKGWQHRWFVLDQDTGTLSYYVSEENKRQRPRGSVNLAGAVISPSDEDSQTFSVNAANGEVYRLRASDAKERQHWVNKLRAVTQYHTEQMAQLGPPLQANRQSSSFNDIGPLVGSTATRRSSAGSLGGHKNSPSGTPVQTRRSKHKMSVDPHREDPFRNVKDALSNTEDLHRELVNNIEALPSSGHHINSLDHDCLLLKATSQAATSTLEQCLSILQQQHLVQSQSNSLPAGASVEWLEPNFNRPSSSSGKVASSKQSSNSDFAVSDEMPNRVEVNIDPSEEVVDSDGDEDKDLGGVEEHKSIILHLLSQLKLGMDLTKVVLPTFILEKRSLLEMFADFMSHPDMFLRIPSLPTAEARMLAVLEYYLCSFHVGRKGSIAKKPYNPIIGETFHCSWEVPQNLNSQSESNIISTSQSQSVTLNGSSETGQSGDSAQTDRVTYVAEQVSHHPPVSAFYSECPTRNICMNTWVWTKSKFLGMSVGVVNVGEGVIYDLEHEEEYTYTLPSAYGRNILTVPWMELGGKVTLGCAKTGYNATVTFHTKPFYGGKVHRISGEMKHTPTNQVICKFNGEWNKTIEFSYTSGERKVIDVTSLPIIKKRVRPLSKQGLYESRKLWNNVTKALRQGDLDTATEHKRYLEERQRSEGKHRAETKTPWQTKLFHKSGEGWRYGQMLKKAVGSQESIS
ncbi:oxysterol-binding protein-related protein 11-like isoform X2 [Ptychodera flava]|uniref:oxysterol-binding protein-related protein 11-like isoform X2 n=1 Tax=Ptychodera flava TaxID=63121 RepID=UPI00396A517D